MDDFSALLAEVESEFSPKAMGVALPSFEMPTLEQLTGTAKAESEPAAESDLFGENPFKDDPVMTGEIQTDTLVVVNRPDPAEMERQLKEAEEAKEQLKAGKPIVPPPILKRDVGYRRREYTKEQLSQRPSMEAAARPRLVTPGQPTVVLRCEMATGRTESIRVSSDFSIANCKVTLARQIGLFQEDLFELGLRRPDGSMHWLVPTMTVADGITERHVLVLAVRLFKTPRYFKDPVAVDLFYAQVEQSIMTGKWPCAPRTSIRLAATKVQMEEGLYNGAKHRVGFLNGRLQSYVPVLTIAPDQYLQLRILSQFAALPPADVKVAKENYISIAHNTPLYGVTMFDVADAASGQQYRLGVAEDGVLLIDRGGNEKYYPFATAVKLWVKESDTTLKITLEDGDPLQLSGTAEVVHDVVDLISTYFCLLCDLSKDCPRLEVKEKPQHLPEASLYRLPLKRFLYNVNQLTRLHIFRLNYIDCCKEDELEPSRKIVFEQIDRTLDEEGLLNELDASGTSMGTKELLSLIRALRLTFEADVSDLELFEENFSLEKLDLSRNDFDKSSIDALGELFNGEANAFRIQALFLNECPKLGRFAAKLAPHLERAGGLRVLSFEGTKIGDVSFKKIVEAMKLNANLHTFNFANCGLGGDAHKLLGNMVAQNNHMHTFNISNNGLGSECGKWLESGIRQNSFLRNLFFAKVGFTAQWWIKLVKWVESHDQVERLDWSDNDLGGDTGKALARVVENSSRLVELRVGNANITPALRTLLPAIGNSRSLRELDISNTNFSGKSAELLIDALQANNYLRVLRIGKCKLSKQSMESVASLMERNKTITTLDVSDNSNGSGAVEAWARMMQANGTIERLHIGGCFDKVLSTFLEALKNHATLVHLHLSGSKIGNALMDDVLALCRSPDYPYLTELSLCDVGLSLKTFQPFVAALADSPNLVLRTVYVNDNKLDAVKGNLAPDLERVPFVFEGFDKDVDPPQMDFL